MATRARRLRLGQFAADQLPLDQKLAIDRLIELFSQANQLGLGVDIGRFAARTLAYMLRLAMNVHNQRDEFSFEERVIVRAAQASLIAKLVKRHPTLGTGSLIQLRQLFGGFA
jgi:hypothetical protein